MFQEDLLEYVESMEAAAAQFSAGDPRVAGVVGDLRARMNRAATQVPRELLSMIGPVGERVEALLARLEKG